MSTQNVSLGTTYQGQTVRLRFRMSTDQGGSAPGWTIDDIALSGTYPAVHRSRGAERHVQPGGR
jgi:bacillopeptidase F (M6 metalloprotease family)